MSRRDSRAASILVRLDASSGEPLHRQIYAGLRRAILSGALAPGVRIPSSRALSAEQYPPSLEQAVLADFLADGHFARHVRRRPRRRAASRSRRSLSII